jgi:hypothetical protein
LEEWVSQLIAFIQSSYAYAFVAWALRPVWQDPIGRTIILTAAGYFVAFSLFTGYFSRFTRGVGGISVQQIGFHWSDVITLLPAGIVAVISIIQGIGKHKWTFVIRVSALIITHGIGIVAALVYVSQVGEMSEASKQILLQVAPGLYLVSLFGLFLAFLWTTKTTWVRISYILLTVSFALFAILAMSFDSSMPPELPIVFRGIDYAAAVIGEGLVIIYALILGFIPFIFGTRIAEEAIRQGMLSRVSHLILQQPLTCLKSYEEPLGVHAEPSVSWKQRWFTKPSFHVSMRPDVYGYRSTPDRPIYLIASLRENLAIFEPGVQENRFNGRLIIINQNLVRAVELQSARETE